MFEERFFEYQDGNGSKVAYECLYTFTSEDTKNNYIIYTDNTLENGDLRIYAAIYKLEKQKIILYPIENEKEWLIVEDKLNQLIK